MPMRAEWKLDAAQHSASVAHPMRQVLPPQGGAELMQRSGPDCSAGAWLHALFPAVVTVTALLKACWRCLRWQATGVAPGRQAAQAGAARGRHAAECMAWQLPHQAAGLCCGCKHGWGACKCALSSVLIGGLIHTLWAGQRSGVWVKRCLAQGCRLHSHVLALRKQRCMGCLDLQCHQALHASIPRCAAAKPFQMSSGLTLPGPGWHSLQQQLDVHAMLASVRQRLEAPDILTYSAPAKACNALLMSLHNAQGSTTSFLVKVHVLGCSYTLQRGQQLLRQSCVPAIFIV